MHKILIIDDEEKMRHIYQRLLTFEDYEALEAQNAETALKLLENQKDVSLVLLDINMPVISGSTLYEVIKRLYGENFKVIVSSVYPLEEQKRLITKADGYYDKSQGTEILLSKVKEILKKAA